MAAFLVCYRRCSSCRQLVAVRRSLHALCYRSSLHSTSRVPLPVLHRTLSISAARLLDSSSGAAVDMFKPTDTITDATGTTGADAAVTASSAEAVESFSSLGLGGYWPSGWIQSTLELLHNHVHLPWWGCIVLLTCLLRVAYFPLAVKMQRASAKLANANSEAQAIHQRILHCKASGDKVGESAAGVDLLKLYGRTAHPGQVFLLGFAQVPIFLSMFKGLRGMTGLPLESMRTGGTLWFTDLIAPDPAYALPLLACGSFLVNIQLGGEGGAPTDNDLSRRVKLVMRVGAVAIVPFTATFPSAVLVYWVSNSMFSMAQILFFKHPTVKEFFGIPKIIRKKPLVQS